jgi:Domain of unknown function (DUF4258)
MSDTLQRIRELVANGTVRISAHGYDERAMDDIMINDIIDGVDNGLLVEDYPDYAKGPCVLVLERAAAGRPIHVVWGIPLGKPSPAVVVTAYRPDPDQWAEDFIGRKR